MKERPMLFSTPMVRAILNGSKTQTRRAVRPQPPTWARFPQPVDNGIEWTDRNVDSDTLRHWPDYYKPMRCPYGQPGDRLWVREPWRAWPDGDVYLADFYDTDLADAIHAPWRPSTRAASRITLEITAVRVERLQEISEADAMAEGIPHSEVSPPDMGRFTFRHLWESINGAGSWYANPWVWVIEFRRVEGQR